MTMATPEQRHGPISSKPLLFSFYLFGPSAAGPPRPAHVLPLAWSLGPGS